MVALRGGTLLMAYSANAVIVSEGFTVPLLIGGATTSRVHTAVKIAPHYAGPVVYVPDASRAVGVTTSLVSAELRGPYIAQVRDDYARLREQHAAKRGPKLVPLADARRNAARYDAPSSSPVAPSFTGRRELRNVDLAAIAGLIDWAPFFQTWELSGSYPAILDDPLVGPTARNALADGKAMLKRVIDGRWLTANGQSLPEKESFEYCTRISFSKRKQDLTRFLLHVKLTDCHARSFSSFNPAVPKPRCDVNLATTRGCFAWTGGDLWSNGCAKFFVR